VPALPASAARGGIIITMASENVELVRRLYETFNTSRAPQVEFFAEDCEWHTASDLPNSDIHRGHAGISALVDDWVASFEEFRADVGELIDRGEHVVAPLVLRGRTRSGDEVSLPETHVWRIRDGLVAEVREYRTLDAALESLS